MKKYISVLLSVVMVVLCLSACNSNINNQNDKLQIVTTIFPVYDWTKEILGNNLDQTELNMLLDNGVDLHSYQPTADDLIKISTCDVFIYVGGDSDEWVKDALENATNKNMEVINLMELLGDYVKEEEQVDGMEKSEHDNEDESEHHENDEHVWLSLKNAKLLCQEIANKLCEKDPENKDMYLANTSVYIGKLTDLDAKYQEVVNNAIHKTLLFGDRFPFRYLVDDYGLDYYAAFAGCSAESEASFETITKLAKKVDELGLTCVLTIEGTKHNIAQTIIANTKNKNQQVLSMDSLQSTTSIDVKNGTTYLSVMEQNLNVLKEALK